MTRHKMVNGIKINFTEAEETARDAEENKAAIDRQARIDAETAAANNKTSAQNKLKALGLTDEEIKAL